MKLCVGHRYEFLAIVKAMLETRITPDFIVVDGGEGGTGAAPVEFVNHVGMPMVEGLSFVHSALVGAGLRNRIKLAASGKIVSAYDICRALALGADYVMSARGFMFAIGCIQSRSCHTNNCPTGVATQDPRRQRALVVSDKARRVANFHRNTLKALGEILGSMRACPIPARSSRSPAHPPRRRPRVRGDDIYMHLRPGVLLSGNVGHEMAQEWALAQAGSFDPQPAEARLAAD